MVSRRMWAARSIRRSDHPRRPKAITCCLFSSFKTFYKRECQEKHFPADLNAGQSSTGIQPRDTGARGCQPESFHIRPFPLGRRRCSERTGAVNGAPICAAKRTLDGEDRSEIIRRRGKGQVTGSVLSADKQKRCQGGNHDSI